MSKKKVISILGEPTSIIGEKDYGYISYGPFRYGFSETEINEMAIEFKFIEKPFILKDLEWIKYDISLFETFKINSYSKIHEIISLINHLQLNWNAQNGIDKDCLVLKITGGHYIVFNLDDGTVDKITIVDGHQDDLI